MAKVAVIYQEMRSEAVTVSVYWKMAVSPAPLMSYFTLYTPNSMKQYVRGDVLCINTC